MYIALYSGQNHRSFGTHRRLVDVGLQKSDGCLHHFGAGQHFSHNQFIALKQPAYLFHAFQQRPVDNLHRCRFFERLSQIVKQTVFGSLNDVSRQPLIKTARLILRS